MPQSIKRKKKKSGQSTSYQPVALLQSWGTLRSLLRKAHDFTFLVAVKMGFVTTLQDLLVILCSKSLLGITVFFLSCTENPWTELPLQRHHLPVRVDLGKGHLSAPKSTYGFLFFVYILEKHCGPQFSSRYCFQCFLFICIWSIRLQPETERYASINRIHVITAMAFVLLLPCTSGVVHLLLCCAIQTSKESPARGLQSFSWWHSIALWEKYPLNSQAVAPNQWLQSHPRSRILLDLHHLVTHDRCEYFTSWPHGNSAQNTKMLASMRYLYYL